MSRSRFVASLASASTPMDVHDAAANPPRAEDAPAPAGRPLLPEIAKWASTRETTAGSPSLVRAEPSGSRSEELTKKRPSGSV